MVSSQTNPAMAIYTRGTQVLPAHLTIACRRFVFAV